MRTVTETVIIVLLVLVAVISACSPGRSPASDFELDGTKWALVGLMGEAPIEGRTPTAEFDGGQIGGSTGCNQYYGSYEVRGVELRFEGIGLTEMACLDPAGIMEQERAFVTALSSVETMRSVSGRLEMLDGSEAVVLTWDEVDELSADDGAEASLEGPRWHLTSVHEGELSSSVVNGTAITAWFNEGELIGTAGCNSYSAPYTLDGGQITVGPVVLTKIACLEPEGVMEQEMRFTAILEDVSSFVLDGDRLTLRTPDGRALELAAVGAWMTPLEAPLTEVSPLPHASPLSPIETPVAQEPAAGICVDLVGEWAVVRVDPDVPAPRCVRVTSDQRLRVINSTDGMVEVRIGHHEATVPPAGQYDSEISFGEHLLPGVYVLEIQPCCGMQIWVTAAQK